ncbi:MAG TPA: AAA family ATPase [Methanoregulaceae archaeon]|nr:AAA family ATPase [Methanoregulaceae archaeon]
MDKNRNISNKKIAKIGIENYKSYPEYKSLEIKNLTVLAGTNSSGKSSIFQLLLLLKQTLENSFDPGPILLDGPHVGFTRIDQMISNIDKGQKKNGFSIEIITEDGISYRINFKKTASEIVIESINYKDSIRKITLKPNWSHSTICNKNSFLNTFYKNIISREEIDFDTLTEEQKNRASLRVRRNRCFLELDNFDIKQKRGDYISYNIFNARQIENLITSIIHVPALRGNPKRLYPKTAIESRFPGTFENYVASIITYWNNNNKEELKDLISALSLLELSKSIEAVEWEDIFTEINVSLSSEKEDRDTITVSIADVGFGVSQTLPVLVALIAASEGQLVYIEQPEIHLHPLAQYKLAEIIANAAKRGVKVVIETHSDILILGIQTCVAEGKIDRNCVILHWFERDESGVTKIFSSDINVDGSYNPKTWPANFSLTSLRAKSKFLDAKEKYRV